MNPSVSATPLYPLLSGSVQQRPESGPFSLVDQLTSLDGIQRLERLLPTASVFIRTSDEVLDRFTDQPRFAAMKLGGKINYWSTSSSGRRTLVMTIGLLTTA